MPIIDRSADPKHKGLPRSLMSTTNTMDMDNGMLAVSKNSFPYVAYTANVSYVTKT